MTETILIGEGDAVRELAREEWEGLVMATPEHAEHRLAFMTEDHHRVRNMAVVDLAKVGRPLEPEYFADRLGLDAERVMEILRDLERQLFFLVRNSQGSVSWAYPVTVDQTPHRLTFSTGERLHGAWAEDVVATPFVQGRLREETLTVEAVTRCAVTGRELRLRIASDLRCEVLSEGAAPFVFEPRLDWQQFSAPNIIHDYWANSVFFWSEEQIHVHRQWPGVLDGTYLTLEQSAFQTPVSQGRLFAFAADLL